MDNLKQLNLLKPVETIQTADTASGEEFEPTLRDVYIEGYDSGYQDGINHTYDSDIEETKKTRKEESTKIGDIIAFISQDLVPEMERTFVDAQLRCDFAQIIDRALKNFKEDY